MGKVSNYVDWENRFSVGVPLIDSQHKHLIAVTNELHKACRFSDDSAKEQFKKTVHDAVAYVKHHFSTEEQVMDKTGFPESAEHKKHHAEFVQEVLKNVKAFENGKQFVPNQFVRFLRDWILSHVAIVDSKMGSFLVELQKTGKLSQITMKRKNDTGKEKQIVLAVDDSKTQLVQFKNILSMYDVFTCESPLLALEMIKQMEVDIILLDLGMAEMNGFEFLQRLRKDPVRHKTPVIIISGNSAEKFITTSKKLGANDFIAKPAEQELLIKKIEQQLEKTKKSQ